MHSDLITKFVRNWMAPPSGYDWVLESEWARIQQRPLKARKLLYVIVMTLSSLLLWAYIAPIDQVVRGEGKVIPYGKLQVVQALDGGVIQNVEVNEGDFVRKGQVLLRIDPTRFLSNLEENNSQYDALEAKSVRLKALLENREFQFPESLLRKNDSLIQNEKILYETSLQEFEQSMSGFEKRIQQKMEGVESSKSELRQNEKLLEINNREITFTLPLLKSGAVSQLDIMQLERQALEIKGLIERTTSAIKRIESEISEEVNIKEETKLKYINSWNKELNETLAKMNGLKSTQIGLNDAVSKAVITSPVEGVIQRMLISTGNAVVTPGTKIMEIVPRNVDLVVEAKIQPKDIAFIKVGQEVNLKFDAYDYAIFGGVKAQVNNISADTVTDEKDKTYYIVKIKSKEVDGDITILPGMVAHADIVIGEKTILQFIINPLIKARDTALKER